MDFTDWLFTLIVFLGLLAIGAWLEQSARPRPELRKDDWMGENGMRW